MASTSAITKNSGFTAGQDQTAWLNVKGTDGLTNNQRIARNLGYQGAFGAGGHTAWMAENANRQQTYNTAVAQNFAAAQTADESDDAAAIGNPLWETADLGGGVTRGLSQNIARGLGYTGGYGGGEHNAWLAADPTRSARYTQGMEGAKRAIAPPQVIVQRAVQADPITANPVSKPEQTTNPLLGMLLEAQQQEMRGMSRRKQFGRQSLFGGDAGFGNVGILRGTLGGA